MQSKKITAKQIAFIGIISALSALLYALPGIPVIPPIYKLDFSIVPVMFGGMTIGPVSVVIIAVIKALTGLMHSSSGGVGEIADFIATVSLALPASLICLKGSNTKKLLLSCVIGILVLILSGALANYYILLPFYGMEGAVKMMSGVITGINSGLTLVLYATVPFNLIKGVVICAITLLLYKYLAPAVKKYGRQP